MPPLNFDVSGKSDIMSALFSLDFISTQVFQYIPNLPYYMMTWVVIMGPTIGYFDQFRKLITMKDPRVYNLPSSLILLSANFIRLLYWISEPFIPYLLGQSILVFSLQIVMGICSFRYVHLQKLQYQSGFQRLKPNLSKIWNVFNASSSIDYVCSLISYALIIVAVYVILCITFSASKINSIAIFISTMVETTVTFPQFKRIVYDHDIAGISTILLCQYMIGDVLKIVMFTFSHAHYAFLIGACLQTGIDITNIITYSCLSKGNLQHSEFEDEKKLLVQSNVYQ